MSLSLASLRSRSPSAQQEFLRSLSDEEAAAILWDWDFWARPEQLVPEGDWLTWLVKAGRGWGKTRVGAEAVRQEVEAGRAMRIAIVAETSADARDVMIEGPSGLLAISPPWNRPVYEPSKRKLTWRNGAEAHTYNATEPDQLRGPQHDFAWADEVAKWQYLQDTWDNLQFGLRIGANPRQVVTTTPRPLPLLRELLEDPTVIVTNGRTLDNAQNLSGKFLRRIVAKYSGTRLGRQELDAEMLDDLPGALWTREMLEQATRDDGGRPILSPPDGLGPIVVAIDPSGASDDLDEEANEIGIIAAGKLADRAYVLADQSIEASPAKWGKRAVDLFHTLRADHIVAETNYGGAMVEHVIKSIDRNVPFRKVTATRGKVLRAEPVSALYEQRRVRHVGVFSQLEDQMCLLGPDGYVGRGSPDRLDALVWAITDLLLGAETSTSTTTLTGLH